MVQVYLADLRHNHSGVVFVDSMPLGIGYMKAVMDRDLRDVQSRLFAYPDHLWSAIQENPPDVLMLSNYCWNEALSFRMARAMKQMRPNSLVVMGGPNIYIEDERKIEYFRRHPEVDVYVLGEGDFLAAEVVRQFLDSGADLERFRQRTIPSSLVRRPGGGIEITETWRRHQEVDEIPSPWTSGIMDPFFDGKLSPMIETNRGCPFSCTFCVQGTTWYTKVHYFSTARVSSDLDYIGRQIRAKSPSMGTLGIADSNYGMFERDVDISGTVADIQAKYGFPRFIVASTGKNRPDRIMKSLERINDALIFRQALQSTNPDTLAAIKRSNIKQSTYNEVMIEVQGRGMRSISDLILGLPKETLRSHVDSIHQLVNSGTEEMYNFQLMLLKGTELEMEKARNEYKFESRYRVIPKAFGVYGKEKVYETEEIVVTTSTLSFEDYVTARKYAFVFSVFWNNSWFEDIVMLAEKCGVKRSSVLDGMLGAIESDEGAAGRILRDFVSETVGELFPTEEACREYYSKEENFRRLDAGDIGDNLLYKYRAMASFFVWPEICKIAFTAVKDLLTSNGVSLGEDCWQDLCRYVELKHAYGWTADQILEKARAKFTFDIGAWIKAGLPVDPTPYRLPGRKAFEFALPEDSAAEIEAALKVWGTDLKSLTKGVTRLRSTAQVRDSVCVE
jgi:radical SAM superfamily enzyme YgiQ (UPF0313 family)